MGGTNPGRAHTKEVTGVNCSPQEAANGSFCGKEVGPDQPAGTDGHVPGCAGGRFGFHDVVVAEGGRAKAATSLLTPVC